MVIDEPLEVLVDRIDLNVEVDAREAFVVSIESDNAGGHALEILRILVPHRLVSIDCREDVLERVAVISGEDHQIIDVT